MHNMSRQVSHRYRVQASHSLLIYLQNISPSAWSSAIRFSISASSTPSWIFSTISSEMIGSWQMRLYTLLQILCPVLLLRTCHMPAPEEKFFFRHDLAIFSIASGAFFFLVIHGNSTSASSSGCITDIRLIRPVSNCILIRAQMLRLLLSNIRNPDLRFSLLSGCSII